MTFPEFLLPGWLWAAPVAAAVAWMLSIRARTSIDVAAPVGPQAGDRPLPPTWRTRLAAALPAIHAIAAMLLCVALARPVRHVAERVSVDGVDVAFAIDVSSSMTAADMGGGRTRIDSAKRAAAQFAASRPRDRIGLVTFARYADIRCPPTLDHRALAALLDGAATVKSDDAEDATGIGGALALAARMLSRGGTSAKVAVLFTDGAENVATIGGGDVIPPEHAAQLCASLRIRLYVVLAGGDADAAQSAANAEFMATLAERTGGRAFTASDAGGAARAFAEIDRIERSSRLETRVRMEERFAVAAGLALVVFLAARLAGASVADGAA